MNPLAEVLRSLADALDAYDISTLNLQRMGGLIYVRFRIHAVDFEFLIDEGNLEDLGADELVKVAVREALPL